MPNPTDPPRPTLENNPYTAFGSFSWDSNDGLVDSKGTKIFAWLNQTGTPGKTASVYWEFGTAAEAGSAVMATVPQSTYDILKNGSYNTNTGVVTDSGAQYSFRFEVSSGTAVMAPYPL